MPRGDYRLRKQRAESVGEESEIENEKERQGRWEKRQFRGCDNLKTKKKLMAVTLFQNHYHIFQSKKKERNMTPQQIDLPTFLLP